MSMGTREVTSATRVKTFLKDREIISFFKVSMVVRTKTMLLILFKKHVRKKGGFFFCTVTYDGQKKNR